MLEIHQSLRVIPLAFPFYLYWQFDSTRREDQPLFQINIERASVRHKAGIDSGIWEKKILIIKNKKAMENKRTKKEGRLINENGGGYFNLGEALLQKHKEE